MLHVCKKNVKGLWVCLFSVIFSPSKPKTFFTVDRCTKQCLKWVMYMQVNCTPYNSNNLIQVNLRLHTCTALVWTLELHYLMTQVFITKVINHSLYMYMKIEVAGCSTTCTWLYIRLFHVSAFSFAGLWDSFLELRIRLQKALLVANKLPQQKQIEEFKSSGDKNLKDEYKQGTESWHLMLDKLLHIFFKLLSWTSLGKSVNPFKLLNLPNLKVIRLNQVKIWLGQVSRIYRRL